MGNKSQAGVCGNFKEQSQGGQHCSIINAFELSRDIIQLSLAQILIHNLLHSGFFHLEDFMKFKNESKQQKFEGSSPNGSVTDTLKSVCHFVAFSSFILLPLGISYGPIGYLFNLFLASYKHLVINSWLHPRNLHQILSFHLHGYCHVITFSYL